MPTRPTLSQAIITAGGIAVAFVTAVLGVLASTDSRAPFAITGVALMLAVPTLVRSEGGAFTAASTLPVAAVAGASIAASLRAAAELMRPIDLGGAGRFVPVNIIVAGVIAAFAGAVVVRSFRLDGRVLQPVAIATLGISIAITLTSVRLDVARSDVERVGALPAASFPMDAGPKSHLWSGNIGVGLQVVPRSQEGADCTAIFTDDLDHQRTARVFVARAEVDPVSSIGAYTCPEIRVDRDEARGLFYVRVAAFRGALPHTETLAAGTLAPPVLADRARAPRVPLGFFASALIACVYAAIELARGRLKARRLRDVLALPRGVHRGDGEIDLEGGGRLDAPEAALLPIGPVAVAIEGTPGGHAFRAVARSLDDRVANVASVARLQAEIDEALAGSAARSVVALLATAIPLAARF